MKDRSSLGERIRESLELEINLDRMKPFKIIISNVWKNCLHQLTCKSTDDARILRTSALKA